MKPRVLVSESLRERLNLQDEQDEVVDIIDRLASVTVNLSCKDVAMAPIVGSLHGIEINDRSKITIEMRMLTLAAEDVYEQFLKQDIFVIDFEVQFYERTIKHSSTYHLENIAWTGFDPVSGMCFVTLGLIKQ